MGNTRAFCTRTTLTLLVALTVVSATGATAWAQVDATACSALKTQIERGEKSLSYDDVLVTMEDSAPRATFRAIQMSNDLEIIRANLAILDAHRCPAYPHPISTIRYNLAAILCRTAELKAAIANTTGQPPVAMPECNRDAWTPMIP